MKRAIVLFIMFMVFAFGIFTPAYAEESTPNTSEESSLEENKSEEKNPSETDTGGEPESNVPSDTDGMQGDLKNEIQGMLDDFKADLDEKYSDKPWYKYSTIKQLSELLEVNSIDNSCVDIFESTYKNLIK